MFSAANSIKQVLTVTSYLCNPEFDYLKLMNMFGKLCLQSGCNLAGIGSLVPKKVDDYSLVILHPKQTSNELSGPDREDHFVKSHTVEPI
jgi:hypothetical protein